MAEVWFYHLERMALEEVLPTLLERSLERGWRAIVRAGTPERVQALDSHLWTYRDDSFLPHGTGLDGLGARQPVYLTDGPENPNAAQALFLVDGAEPGDVAGFTRVLDLFNGRDDAAVDAARGRWRTLKAQGHDISYWQQDRAGKWAKKA